MRVNRQTDVTQCRVRLRGTRLISNIYTDAPPAQQHVRPDVSQSVSPPANSTLTSNAATVSPVAHRRQRQLHEKHPMCATPHIRHRLTTRNGDHLFIFTTALSRSCYCNRLQRPTPAVGRPSTVSSWGRGHGGLSAATGWRRAQRSRAAVRPTAAVGARSNIPRATGRSEVWTKIHTPDMGAFGKGCFLRMIVRFEQIFILHY
jgi:hypothetical protein